jgi:co-chaperonin GroES (HSP10)
MNPISEKISAFGDRILVTEMEFGMEKTKSGILLHSDDGKGSGVHPRWAKVYAVGPTQTNVKVGDWVLLQHGRWSRGVEYVDVDGNKKTLRRADNDAIMLISDEKPDDIMRSETAGPGSNFNFNIPGA